MNKKSFKINTSTKDLAATLGLSPLEAMEWQIRHTITNKIIECANNYTVTEIAKTAGTSRARITKILKGDTFGISLDVLIRVLGAVGEEVKISFKRAS